MVISRTMTAATTPPYYECRTKTNSNKKGYAFLVIARGIRKKHQSTENHDNHATLVPPFTCMND